jgi:predicted nucleotidyltransferase
LVEHGLVTAEPANQGHLYRLNRDHVLAGPVLAIARSRAAVLQRIQEAVDRLRPEPVHVSLFGSFARGEAGSASDIDVLIVAATEDGIDDDAWFDQIDQIGAQVHAWTGNRLEHLVLSLDRLHQVAAANEPIVRSWIEESELLMGRPLTTLLANKDTVR